jgi:hypothetical protein
MVKSAQDSLPSQPVVYDLVTRLVLTSREPYQTEVMQLCPGQPLQLHRDENDDTGSQAILVMNSRGRAVGKLSVDVASYLSILMANQQGIVDESFAETILLAAPPGNLAARRQRYPKLTLHMRLKLPSAQLFFVIAVVLGVKQTDFAGRFNLDGNPWLSPLRQLHDEYRQLGHDLFRLPPEVADTWFKLNPPRPSGRKTGTSHSLTNPCCDDKMTR